MCTLKFKKDIYTQFLYILYALIIGGGAMYVEPICIMYVQDGCVQITHLFKITIRCVVGYNFKNHIDFKRIL
jgi:hypothetical protein